MARAYTAGMLTGVAVSVAAAALAPVWRPALARWGRPLMKGAVKQGVLAFAAVRERTAEMSETVTDLVAEVQVELATEHAARATDEAGVPHAAD